MSFYVQRVDKAGPGDNVGMNIKGLDKGNMPRTGDVMILKSDASLKPCANFTAQIQTLDIPGEVKAGYSPIGFVRCGRSACRLSKIDWKVSGSCWCSIETLFKTLSRHRGRHDCPQPGTLLTVPLFPVPQVGKETGGKKLDEPTVLKANEMAQVVFEPCQPMIVESFKSCEGLSRIAFLDGNTAVMLGKVCVRAV